MKRGVKVRVKGKCTAVVFLFAAVAMILVGTSTPAQAQSRDFFRTGTPEFEVSVKLGHQMFNAYQCAKCHAIREGEPLTDAIVAPNLILAKSRLRPEWMLEWLIDPQALQRGTKMPNFFSFNEDDDGHFILNDADAHEQYKIIVALRDYLMVLGTDLDPDFVPGAGAAPAATATAPAADQAEAKQAEAAEDAEEWEDYYGY